MEGMGEGERYRSGTGPVSKVVFVVLCCRVVVLACSLNKVQQKQTKAKVARPILMTHKIGHLCWPQMKTKLART